MRVVGAFAILASAVLVACGSPSAVPPADSGAGVEVECGTPQLWASGGGLQVEEPLGPRAVGAVCALGTQCASGLCSADRAAGTCGVCLERRGLGETCDGASQGCADSAACQDGTCVSKKKVVGATCALYRQVADLALECDDELFCDPGEPPWDSATGVCAPRIPVGRPCGSFQPCIRGADCREGACVSVDPGGTSCQDPTCPSEPSCGGAGPCAAGSLCKFESIYDADSGSVDLRSSCVPAPRAGEACVLGRCAAGFYCLVHGVVCSTAPVEERCEPLRVLGESCETSPNPGRDAVTQFSTCAPGLECRKDRCERPCA